MQEEMEETLILSKGTIYCMKIILRPIYRNGIRRA